MARLLYGGVLSGRQLTTSTSNTTYAAADGVEPKTVIDSKNNYFTLNSVRKDDLWDVIDNDGATGPLDMSTVIDSDQSLKWPLHNLYTGGTATATNQTLTFETLGVKHTVSFEGDGTVDLSSTETIVAPPTGGTGATDASLYIHPDTLTASPGDLAGWDVPIDLDGEPHTVLHVTNLNASGAGSLVDAISTDSVNDQTTWRIIVFDVAGRIDFNGGVFKIQKDRTIILGQTAPGNVELWDMTDCGVTGAQKVAVYHLAFRMRPNYDIDAWHFNTSQYVRVQNCSFQFATDEIMSFEGSASNTAPAGGFYNKYCSVVDCMLSMPTLGDWGEHRFGTFIRSFNYNLGWYRNLISGMIRGVPRSVNPNQMQYVNNVLVAATDHNESPATNDERPSPAPNYIDWVGNEYIGWDIYPRSTNWTNSQHDTIIYAEDNVARTGWNAIAVDTDTRETHSSIKYQADWIYPPSEPLIDNTKTSTKEFVIAHAGARPNSRDAVDTIVVNEIKANNLAKRTNTTNSPIDSAPATVSNTFVPTLNWANSTNGVKNLLLEADQLHAALGGVSRFGDNDSDTTTATVPVGSVTGGSSGRVSFDFVPNDTIDFTITGTVSNIAVYRSDLGGMQKDLNGSDYLEAPSGARFTYGRHYDLDGALVGIPMFGAGTNLYKKDTIASYINNLDGNSATFELSGDTVLGTFNGVRVASTGTDWNRVDDDGTGMSVTSGQNYAVTVIYRLGSSGRLAWNARQMGFTLNTRVEGSVTSIENTQSGSGSVSDIVVEYTNDGPGAAVILKMIWTPNFTGDVQFGWGPSSGTAGEDVIVYYQDVKQANIWSPIVPNLDGSTSNTRATHVNSLTTTAAGVVAGQGTVVAEFTHYTSSKDATTDRTIFTLDDGDENDQVVLYFDSVLKGGVTSGGTTTASLSQTTIPAVATMTWNTNVAYISGDGSTISSDTTVTVPTVTTLRLGKGVSGKELNGYLTQFAIYGSQIAQSDLETLSSTSIPGTDLSPPTGPVNTVLPVVTGSNIAGNTLTVTDGTWTGTAPIAYTYQWQRNGSNIGGATNSTYTTVDPTDVGTAITCEVTATNPVTSAVAESVAITISDPVDIPAPINTVAPSISGSTSVGTTLSVNVGTWNGDVTNYTYRWFRGGTAISGATSSTYVTKAADVGATITAEVTATNNGGSNSALTSNSITVVTQTDAVGALTYHQSTISQRDSNGNNTSQMAGYDPIFDVNWETENLSNAEVVFVDNLNDVGAGSLNQAVCGKKVKSGNITDGGDTWRFVIPRVSGPITRDSNGYPNFTRSKTWFFGECAPLNSNGDGGIAIVDDRATEVSGHDIVIGHLKSYVTKTSTSGRNNSDTFRVLDRGGNATHGSSTSWAADGTWNIKLYNMAIWGGSDEGFTVNDNGGTNTVRHISIVDSIIAYQLIQPDNTSEPHHNYSCYFLDPTDRAEITRCAMLGGYARMPMVENGAKATAFGNLVICERGPTALFRHNAYNKPSSTWSTSTSGARFRRMWEAGMSYNTWRNYQQDEDSDIDSMWNVAWIPSDHYTAMAPNGITDQADNAFQSGIRTRIFADGNFVRNWRKSDPLTPEVTKRYQGSTASELRHIQYVDVASHAPKHKAWNPAQLVSGQAPQEVYVPQYAGPFPATPDSSIQNIWSQALDDADNKLVAPTDIPSYRPPRLSYNNISVSGHTQVGETITPPANPFELVQTSVGKRVPRIIKWAHDNYHVPRGGLPYL